MFVINAEDPLEGPSTSGYAAISEKEAGSQSLKRQVYEDETPTASTKKIKILQTITGIVNILLAYMFFRTNKT